MSEKPAEKSAEGQPQITDGKAATRFGEAVARDIAPKPNSKPRPKKGE